MIETLAVVEDALKNTEEVAAVIVITPVTCAKLPPRAGVANPLTFHKFCVVAVALNEKVD